jgi:hypothetical protein
MNFVDPWLTTIEFTGAVESGNNRSVKRGAVELSRICGTGFSSLSERTGSLEKLNAYIRQFVPVAAGDAIQYHADPENLSG